MPRLKFESAPIDRSQGWWQSREENDEWVRSCWSNWDRQGEPAPCDCGYFSDGWLVTCDARDRAACRRDVQVRLEARARGAHEKALAAKREFPALPRCPMGTCYWCREPITLGRAKQRSMHDGRGDEPDCRWAYEVHTRREPQQTHLLDRDGRGCKVCGALVGRFSPIWTDPTEDRVANTWQTRAWIRRRFAERPAGPVTYISWSSGLEVDHFIALAVAFVAFPDARRRRWFFGPANLQLLCNDCHKAKTSRDRALLRGCYERGEAWAKAEVLHRLSDAGLIRIARPEEAHDEAAA